MYSNYFKTAWRNLLKHPFYSFINMVGLGLGLIAVFFIFLYVKDELSYDRYHKNICLLYTSDAADERSRVDLGGRRIIKKNKIEY